MKRTFAISTALLLAVTACGGGEPAEEASEPAMEPASEAMEPAADAMASDELQMPDWYQYDEASNTVTLDITAGATDALNYWNFNGYTNGAVTVVVPTGAMVHINFSNDDGNGMAHSIGVAPFSDTPPAMLEPTPVFDGAISENPTSMTDATMPGESEMVMFTAAEAGEYALACYSPGHAVAGMWIGFVVSADGEAGVRGAL